MLAAPADLSRPPPMALALQASPALTSACQFQDASKPARCPLTTPTLSSFPSPWCPLLVLLQLLPTLSHCPSLHRFSVPPSPTLQSPSRGLVTHGCCCLFPHGRQAGRRTWSNPSCHFFFLASGQRRDNPRILHLFPVSSLPALLPQTLALLAEWLRDKFPQRPGQAVQGRLGAHGNSRLSRCGNAHGTPEPWEKSAHDQQAAHRATHLFLGWAPTWQTDCSSVWKSRLRCKVDTSSTFWL